MGCPSGPRTAIVCAMASTISCASCSADLSPVIRRMLPEVEPSVHELPRPLNLLHVRHGPILQRLEPLAECVAQARERVLYARRDRRIGAPVHQPVALERA